MPYITVGSDWLKGGFLTCLPPLRPVRRYWYNRERIRLVKGVQNEKE